MPERRTRLGRQWMPAAACLIGFGLTGCSTGQPDHDAGDTGASNAVLFSASGSGRIERIDVRAKRVEMVYESPPKSFPLHLGMAGQGNVLFDECTVLAACAIMSMDAETYRARRLTDGNLPSVAGDYLITVDVSGGIGHGFIVATAAGGAGERRVIDRLRECDGTSSRSLALPAVVVLDDETIVVAHRDRTLWEYDVPTSAARLLPIGNCVPIARRLRSRELICRAMDGNVLFAIGYPDGTSRRHLIPFVTGAVAYSEAHDILFFTEPTWSVRGESANLHAYEFATGARRHLVSKVVSGSLLVLTDGGNDR